MTGAPSAVSFPNF